MSCPFSQPVEHFRPDVPVRCVGAESEDGECCRFERRVEARFGQRLHFSEAFRQRSKGECLTLVAEGLCGGIDRLLGCAFQFVKDSHCIFLLNHFIPLLRGHKSCNRFRLPDIHTAGYRLRRDRPYSMDSNHQH